MLHNDILKKFYQKYRYIYIYYNFVLLFLITLFLGLCILGAPLLLHASCWVAEDSAEDRSFIIYYDIYLKYEQLQLYLSVINRA